MTLPRWCAALLLLLVGCGGPTATDAPTTPSGLATRVAPDPARGPPDPAPTGRLPDDATPQHYRLSLTVLPEQERFQGEVWIRVAARDAWSRLWMHGARMDVSVAEVEIADEQGGRQVIPARWEPAEGRDEIAALRTSEPVPAGDATIHLAYSAPFDRQLRGLYRVDVGDDRYAFTQFEATSARYAFPSFDEPRWKTPFDVELTVHRDHRAIGNARELESVDVEGELKRVRFATTLPLPTYLVALAVGPLDVVDAPPIAPNAVRSRPLPFRGVAARGRGPELARALAGTPELLAALEAYFGSEYPYDKLDIVAVPDFASGAMENAGLITFREQLLLLGDRAPVDQVRGFTNVMAHELAHQWFGNLVTMPWWDDIWLNEAFATWMANKIVAQTHPEMHGDLGELAGVHGAMGQDSLAAARRIRQPIEQDHDIRNAFDSITYQKGGAVLGMFEQWMGPDAFREGIRVYLRQHRFGSATSQHLLAALSEVAGRDVATPFGTFLEQPGVPLMEARVACDGDGARLELAQSRYVPVGGAAPREQVWSVPACVTYPAGRANQTSCDLIGEQRGTIALEGATGCPTWAMPNAGGRGYYRWSLPPEQWRALLATGLPRLSPIERLSLANDLRAVFASAALPAADVLDALPRLAADEERLVASEPMGVATNVLDTMVPADRQDAARAWAGSLYAAKARRVGWQERPNEDGEAKLARRDVLAFMAFVARDERVRREAAQRGRAFVGSGGDGAIHRDAVPSDLVGIALSVAVQEGDAALWDAMAAHLFATEDAILRQRLLAALASTEDPALADRALELAIDPRLRVNEVLTPLQVQSERPEGRERAWAWAQRRFDALAARIATTRGGAAPWIFAGFCDADHARAVEQFFEPRIASLPGGPRNLRGAVEAIQLCAARAEAQRASVAEFFARR